jgi:hypothetical protein
MNDVFVSEELQGQEGRQIAKNMFLEPSVGNVDLSDIHLFACYNSGAD